MQNKKKIMLLVPMLHQGGFERVCADTVHLLKDKFEIYVVVFNSEDMIYDVSEADGFIDLKLGALNGKLQKLVQVFKRAVSITRLQKKLKIDVCYSFGETANLASVLCMGTAKKIVSCHSFGEIKDSFKMKLILNRADRVICCAKAMKQEISERYGIDDKVKAIWNPCDIEAIRKKGKLGIPMEHEKFFGNGDKLVISMGREDDVKGFWHLLKAFRHVNEVLPDTKLVIVGEGGFNEYKEMSAKLNIRNSVLFTGVYKNPFPFLEASNVYVLSSLSEGLPNALVEALALELPIVSVNCKSGPAEILSKDWKNIAADDDFEYEDYGILTPPLSQDKNTECEWDEEKIKLEKSEEKLASAIIKMLEDADIYQKYKAASLTRALEFSGEKYKENIINIIDDIL